MHSTSTVRSLILAFLMLVPGALQAGGSSEEVQPADGVPRQALTQVTVQAYWFLEEGAANAKLLLERFYLPTSLSVLRWTKFTVSGGNVELDAAGGYRVVRKEPILAERWNGQVLYGYSVRIDFAGQSDEPARSSRRIRLRFAYDTAHAVDDGTGSAEAGSVPQPLQQALLKGIEASGKRSGLARVLELRYEGKGRFSAQVEVQ